MTQSLWPVIAPVLLLSVSNLFMTTAWYWHLKVHHLPLWSVVLISWGIALFEYCLAVPANRIGHGVWSAAELKTLQEVITLVVFSGFAWLYLGERLTLNHGLGFAFIVAGAYFIFAKPIG